MENLFVSVQDAHTQKSVVTQFRIVDKGNLDIGDLLTADANHRYLPNAGDQLTICGLNLPVIELITRYDYFLEFAVFPKSYDWTLVHTHEDGAFGGPYFLRADRDERSEYDGVAKSPKTR